MNDKTAADLRAALRPFGEEAIRPDDAELVRIVRQALTSAGMVNVTRLSGPLPPNSTGVVQDESVEVSFPAYSTVNNLEDLLDQIIAGLGASGIVVEEVDGTPSGVVTQLTFPNGSVTIDTANEIATVSLAGLYQPLDADLTTIAGLVDPNADRILFWDDSAGAYAYLTAGTNLTITGTTIDASGGSGAPDDATYIVQTAHAGLSAEQALSTLSTGIVKVTNGTGVLSTAAAADVPLDATLTSLAAYNTNGLITQTAADTFTGRTITGTANEITVTNGSGVGGNPTLSLPSGIDAAKIGGGGVSTTEFDYLSTLTSNVQTQIDAITGGGGVSGSDPYWSKWVSQNYYCTAGFFGQMDASQANSNHVADTMHASLLRVPAAASFDQIALTISGAVALSTIRLGVYAVGATGEPGALIADWGTVASTANGTATLTISWAPAAGWYFLVQSATHAVGVQRILTGVGAIPYGRATVTFSSSTDYTRASAGSSTALPNPFGAPTVVATHRPLFLKHT